ncbi:MAG: xanthine dehydrogenase family protein molybdopterin-binding subunit [Firmicutes bacterium]|nr:xanthine dehydrogenase family protein molybdopterin-binding subunit [Bacillota bacterium]
MDGLDRGRERLAAGKERLLRGEGRFVADLRLPGCLEMVVVRSPHAHARLAAVDVSAARADPRLRGALTAEDLRRLAPRALAAEPPALAEGEVRYVGQPVLALAVAGDRYEAEDLLERVHVEYEPLPARSGVEGEGPRVRPERPHDDAFADELAYGDVDAAFAAADVVVAFEQRLARAGAQPLETRGVVSAPDPLGGLTVYAATQAPHALRRALAETLGLAEGAVRVSVPDVGGAFGVKNGLYPEDLLCALLAMRTGLPVRFVEDRREHFAAAAQERESIQRVRVAARRDGTLLGLEAEIVADHGAFAFRFPIAGHTATSAPVAYRLPAYRARVRSAFTHKTPQGPYRGAGRPQGNYLMERAMDRLADALGMDRVEVRRRNLRAPHEFPLTLPLSGRRGPHPLHVDGADLSALLDAALGEAERMRLFARREEARARGEAFGIGVSLSLEDTGAGPYEGARLDVGLDGRVHVVCGAPDQGQGHGEAFARIVAETLGVDAANVRVEATDTSRLERGVGTFASRTATAGAVAVHKAAAELRRRLLEAAAAVLEADPADLEIGPAGVHVRGAPARALSLAELARRVGPVQARAPVPPGTVPELSAVAYAPAERAAYGAAAHVAAVAVDREVLVVRPAGYVIAYDVGRRLSPPLVEGQILGGLAHGLSGALLEELGHDEGGQLLTQSFLDYLLPMATDMPPVRLVHRETPTPLTPLGAKGVGESGTIPAAAALASAVEDALGVAVDRLPMRPDRLFDALGRRPAAAAAPAAEAGRGPSQG